MTFGIEGLLTALAFLLPGFLTSRLISARTPAVGKDISAFQETFESLLRSVYIHLIIAPIVFVIVKYILIKGDFILISRINSEGIQAYYLARPFQVTLLLFVWLFFAFVLALVFGSVWDPLEALFNRLVKKTGTSSEDVFYQLRDYVAKRREHGEEDCQLWIQARLKNGYTYQGEFVFAGYRQDGLSRELMLTHVKFFPYPAQTAEQVKGEPKLYDFVLIDVANCNSLEVLLGRDAP